MATHARMLRAGPLVAPRRMVGVGLVAYGVAGIVLAAVVIAAVGPPDLAGLGRIDRERESIATLISTAEATATDSKEAVTRARSSVEASAAAAAETADFARQLASALRQLGSSMRVEVFGTRPFETAAADVEQAADRADAAAAGLDRAAGEARAGADGLTKLEADLDAAARSLASVREGLVAAGGVSVSVAWLRIVLVALALWLGVPALVCVWIGRRLLADSRR